MSQTVLVIGGGPAGMMAALAAAQSGATVRLLEKNTRLGRKLRISGKGRCNVTNDCTREQFIAAMGATGKFLYSAVSGFGPAEAMAFFEDNGVPLKVERGRRVFPVSDQSGDIVACLEHGLRRAGAEVLFHTSVSGLVLENGAVRGVVAAGRVLRADAVIVATGGLSYPLTGSTGDGYRLAEQAGLQVNETFPSLTPLYVAEADVAQLEGLSLRNAELTLKDGDQELLRQFGELVFTDRGLSGPSVLTASRACGAHFLHSDRPLTLTLDFKPARTEEQLTERIQRDFETFSRRKYSTILEELLPKKMIPVFVVRSGIDPWTIGHKLTKDDRTTILRLLKAFPFTVTGCAPMAEAIVTAGGVDVRGLEPKTMKARQVAGLYFAGEVLDVDGPTGGYNIQAALATGRAAGLAAARAGRAE